MQEAAVLIYITCISKRRSGSEISTSATGCTSKETVASLLITVRLATHAPELSHPVPPTSSS